MDLKTCRTNSPTKSRGFFPGLHTERGRTLGALCCRLLVSLRCVNLAARLPSSLSAPNFRSMRPWPSPGRGAVLKATPHFPKQCPVLKFFIPRKVQLQTSFNMSPGIHVKECISWRIMGRWWCRRTLDSPGILLIT